MVWITNDDSERKWCSQNLVGGRKNVWPKFIHDLLVRRKHSHNPLCHRSEPYINQSSFFLLILARCTFCDQLKAWFNSIVQKIPSNLFEGAPESLDERKKVEHKLTHLCVATRTLIHSYITQHSQSTYTHNNGILISSTRTR